MAVTLIKNGHIVTAADSYVADILVEGEKIKAIGQNLPADGHNVVDAGGKYVFPGAIDVHTHLDLPFGGTVAADDFYTGHVAAAFGGTTTHIDFAIQGKGETLKQAVENWHARADRKAAIDYGFHIAITDLPESVMREIPKAPDYGVTSLKLFMAYKGSLMVDDGTLFNSLMVARDSGMLICVHAENGDAIDVLVKKMQAEGKLEPIYHALSRPHFAEAEATARAAALAMIAGSPLYVVHMSCASAVEQLRWARETGAPIMGETCTQYLFFTEDDLRKPNFEGAKFVCSPPMRTKFDQDALWKAIAVNDLQAVSTDHCPFNFKGQKDLGKEDFSKIPNGVPGIEDRLKIMYSYGVTPGKISLNRWVELLSTNPAKIFGLYPRKGTIAVGSDADLVIWDPNKEQTISAFNHHMNVDYNLYEGWHVKGMPEKVFLRGRLIVDGDSWYGEQGKGEYLCREKFSHAM